MTSPTCSSSRCGAPIRWALTAAGRRLPLDPIPDPSGNVILEHVGDNIRARILTGEQLPAQVEAYVPHFKTCPDSPEFRRLRERAIARERAIRLPCPTCSTPLDPWLATQGFDRHIGCLPPIDHLQAVAEARRQINLTRRNAA